MKIAFLPLLILALSSRAQTEKQWLQQAEKNEAALNETAAFEAYKKVLLLNPKNYTATWKLSELCSRIGNRQATPEKKSVYFHDGKTYAEAAIRLNPAAADGYYVLAVALGRFALTKSGKEKIATVKEIRANAEKALQLNPRHGRAWHVVGKWHYEVSDLNLLEKTAVKLMYGGLPPASIAESIQAYEKANTYEPNFALNYLELAKAYHRAGQTAKAVQCLKTLPALPNKTADDTRIKSEGAALLKQWGN